MGNLQQLRKDMLLISNIFLDVLSSGDRDRIKKIEQKWEAMRRRLERAEERAEEPEPSMLEITRAKYLKGFMARSPRIDGSIKSRRFRSDSLYHGSYTE